MNIKNHTKITITSKNGGQTVTILDTKEDKIGHVVAGIPITECVDDSLDSLVVTIKCADKSLFESFDIVTLTVSDERGESVSKMVVGSDNIQSYQRKQNTYTHVVQLVELTKILEKTKIFGLNLTNTHDTLLRQFEKALNNAELLVNAESYTDACRFVLSDGLRTSLTNKPSEDFWFSNTDMRSVLDTMLSSSNSRACVEDIKLNSVGDITSIIIGHRPLNRVNKIIPIWTRSAHGQIISEEQQNNCQDFAGKIIARGDNTLSKNTVTITDCFKSGEATITTENIKAFLPFPIGEAGISSFIIKVLQKDIDNNSGSIIGGVDTIYFRNYVDLDISSRLIPIEQYEILSEEDKRKYLPINTGSNFIDFSKVYSLFFGTEPIIFNIVQDLVGTELPSQIIYGDRGLVSVEYNASIYKDHPFICTYCPQINTAVEISKPNVYDQDTLKMGIMSSQTENTLDIERHGRQLAGLIRRTGNAEWYIDVEATHYRNLLPLMSKIDDGYVVYKRETAIYDNFVKCRYYLSKDFNAVERKAGVNRERHLYDIPLESDEAPLLLKQYLSFSKTSPVVEDRTFDTELITNALKTLTGETASKIKYMLLKTKCGDESFPQNTENSAEPPQYPYTDDKYVFVRPTLNYGQAKSINFAASVLDNYSIDYSRDGYVFSLWGDAGNMMTYCRYVSKNTNTIGECDRFEVDFAFECKVFENREDYSDEEYNSFVQGFPIADSMEFEKVTTRPFTIKYYKDRTQKPVFFTSIECVPAQSDFDDIVIGSAFCRDNTLVTGSAVSDLKLFISSTETLYDGAESIGEGFVEVGNVSNYFEVAVNVTNKTVYEQLVSYDNASIYRYVLNALTDAWSSDSGTFIALNDADKSITITSGLLQTPYCEINLPPLMNLGDVVRIEYDSIAEISGTENAKFMIGVGYRGQLGDTYYHVIGDGYQMFSVNDNPKAINITLNSVIRDTTIFGKPTFIFIGSVVGTWKFSNLRLSKRIVSERIEKPLLSYNGGELNIKSWAIANEAKELYLGANGSPCDIFAHLAQYPGERRNTIHFSNETLVLTNKTANEIDFNTIHFSNETYFVPIILPVLTEVNKVYLSEESITQNRIPNEIEI